MQFKILQAISIGDLERQVEEQIQKKWLPFGAVSVVPKTEETSVIFLQSMVKQ